MSAGPTALITGGRGQLGTELTRTAPQGWHVLACGTDTLDVADPAQVGAVLARERPDVVINAAAYTAVDAAESEPDRAEAVNVGGAANVAEAARTVGTRLIHVSTDFVFDGRQSRPYQPDDPTGPLNVYGRTKLAGEAAVARISGGGALIIRTSWLYSSTGRNFARTMLRLLEERDLVQVVADQVGTPTWARSCARAIWAAVNLPDVRGIAHWSDAGVASWYDFAVAVQEEAEAAGLLRRRARVRPIRTGEHPTAATRPAYSVLDCTETRKLLGLRGEHWRVHLRAMLAEVGA